MYTDGYATAGKRDGAEEKLARKRDWRGKETRVTARKRDTCNVVVRKGWMRTDTCDVERRI